MNFPKNKKYRYIASRTLFAALGCCALTSLAIAQSNAPWLPIPGSGSLSLGYVNQEGDSAYVGNNKLPISAITGGAAQRYKRDTYSLRLAYGVNDNISVDGTITHSKTKVGAADNSSGIADSVLGANWRVLDEFERRNLPTVTLRVSAILNGGYDGARLAALGKDANGYGLAMLVGRQITQKISVWGGLGAEKRDTDVPTAKFFDLNAAYTVLPKLSLSAGYTNKKFDGNLDIGGPGFTPAAFQKVREERETVRIGASYAITAKQSVGLNLGQAISGRNTVRDDRIVGLSYSLGF